MHPILQEYGWNIEYVWQAKKIIVGRKISSN